ncbi:hypothetical protein [Catenulispora pinisilvae]|uniref:hypothetical protein n=1 Tax=Catenulispora pinisilvae TaxID=2705253 RepID=UPI00189152A6|nr:hypothetical protein [Catenulispora pinisilvae]
MDAPWSRWPPYVETEFRVEALKAVRKAGLDERDGLQSLEEERRTINRVVAPEYLRWRVAHSGERRAARRAGRRAHWYESWGYGLWVVVLIVIWACTTGAVFAEAAGDAVSLADVLAGQQSTSFPGGMLCEGGPAGLRALAAAGRDTGIMLAALILLAAVFALRLHPIGKAGDEFFPSLRTARTRRARQALEARDLAHAAWGNALRAESMTPFLRAAPGERATAMRVRTRARRRGFAARLATRTLGCIAVVLSVLGTLVAFFAACFGAVQAFEWLTDLTGGRPTLCLSTSPGVHALSSLIVVAVTASPLLVWLRRDRGNS